MYPTQTQPSQGSLAPQAVAPPLQQQPVANVATQQAPNLLPQQQQLQQQVLGNAGGSALAQQQAQLQQQQQLNLQALQAAQSRLPPGVQYVRLPNGQYAVQQVAGNNAQAGQQAAVQLGQQQHGNALTLQQVQAALQAGMQPSAAQQQQQQQAQPQTQTQAQQQQTEGFTADQLSTLKYQILAFKQLKKGSLLDDFDLAQICPKPLPAPLPAVQYAPQPIQLQQLQQQQQQQSMQQQPMQQQPMQQQQQPVQQQHLVLPAGQQPISQLQQAINFPELQRKIAQAPKPRPPPGQVQQQASKAQATAAAAARAGQAAAAAQNALLAQQRARAAAAAAAAAPIPLPPDLPPLIPDAIRRQQGPLVTLTDWRASDGVAPPMDHVGPAYAIETVPSLLKAELDKRVERKRKRRMEELQAMLTRVPGGGGSADEGVVEAKRPRWQEVQNGPSRAELLTELRSLRLLDMQRKLRQTIEDEQQEVMEMGDRQYRKFARDCARTRAEVARAAEKARADKAAERAADVKRFKGIMQDRAGLSKDMRTVRTKGVARLHERLARDHSKLKGDDASRRLDALRANDIEAYQQLLRAQHKGMTGGAPAGAASEGRFQEIEKFLNDTEQYLNQLALRVAQVKVTQEASQMVQQVMNDARERGASEEEVADLAKQAATESARNSELTRKVHSMASEDAQSRYYSLAHSVNEAVAFQPRLLKPPEGGKLREYQMVGLQWMVSLYNNHLNGILADEMGLGKTVQVMALIAYLIENKQNYGPHLIIVPNAVMVNWKSELAKWLPSVKCVYYTGTKEERARKFTQEVASVRFNVLVTTYEYIMRDRTKLSRLEWKYIIIDEAQRMKDRKSKLAQDLDRFTTQRRLLLTGTPLQNELGELWSLLNLLLPEVFDEAKSFGEWFGEFLSGKNEVDDGSADSWLMREKRVVVIHRLHQILEPFMLRRQVQDVEGKLPPKVAIVVKCAMSKYQAAIYDWVKATGTFRVDPANPTRKNIKHDFIPLQNKVMELRKVCNHPMLTYPYDETGMPAPIVRQCGKMKLLDSMLVKLFHSGHRVLLFSTMTKLLDLLEEYLRWRAVDENGRTMGYARIDGSTTLEDREKAIQEFNRPKSSIFIFLLSIRAAGRGLNLQSADTVIIYDPDPNPKNEEQAIARSHRIGQTKEVRVFHMEAVCELTDDLGQKVKPTVAPAQPANPLQQQQQADAGAGPSSSNAAAQGGAAGPSSNGTKVADALLPAAPKAAEEDDVIWLRPPEPEPGQKLYADSIESLVRNLIQKQKIEMANEVIDAGRFDMQTTMDERRKTLESLLSDEERLKVATNISPTLEQLNRMVARTADEYELFQRLDEEMEWPGELLGEEDVPWHLRFSIDQVIQAQAMTQKKPARTGMLATAAKKAAKEQGLPVQLGKRKPGRPPKAPRVSYAPMAAAGGLDLTAAHAALAPAAEGAGPSYGGHSGGGYGSVWGDAGDDDDAVTTGVPGGDDDTEEERIDANIDEDLEQEIEEEERKQQQWQGSGAAGLVSQAAGAPGMSRFGGITPKQEQQWVGQQPVPKPEQPRAGQPHVPKQEPVTGAPVAGAAAAAVAPRPITKFKLSMKKPLGQKPPGAPP